MKETLELNAWEEGCLSAHLLLVKRGVRPAAGITLRREMSKRAKEAIRKAGLRCLVEPCGKTHVELTVFLHPHLAKVIRQIPALPFPLRDWALGKLYGYGEDEIGTWLASCKKKKNRA